eukprot:460142_1
MASEDHPVVDMIDEIINKVEDINDDSKNENMNEETGSINDCKSAQECKCISRMCEAMKFYQTIKHDMNNRATQDKLITYCNESHASLVNDYVHIITYHNDNDLHYMANTLINDNNFMQCNINDCKCTKRYYGNRRININNEKQDSKYSVYKNIMDQMHCNVLHLWDMGMRVKLDKAPTDDRDLFSHIRDSVREQINQLDNSNEQNVNAQKYSIDIDNKDNDVEFKEITFLDGLYEELQQQKTPIDRIKAFHKYINDEEYDSDSLKADMMGLICEANIDCCTTSNMYNFIERYIYITSIYQDSFSTGYTFYYWDHYKPSEESIKQQQKGFLMNRNDHGGYEVKELYINIKYKNIKEETLQNAIFYLDLASFIGSRIKADTLMLSKRAKNMKSCCAYLLYYGIDDDTPLSVNNLLSIILYTDYTDL